jgi:hypothetical protein
MDAVVVKTDAKVSRPAVVVEVTAWWDALRYAVRVEIGI